MTIPQARNATTRLQSRFLAALAAWVILATSGLLLVNAWTLDRVLAGAVLGLFVITEGLFAPRDEWSTPRWIVAAEIAGVVLVATFAILRIFQGG